MRFVLTFGSGLVLGYTLHVKKDQTIESFVSSTVSLLEKRTATMRDKFLTSAN